MVRVKAKVITLHFLGEMGNGGSGNSGWWGAKIEVARRR